MLCFKGVLVDGIYYKLNLHIHQANKEKGVLDIIPGCWQMCTIFRTNVECPRLVIIDVSERNIFVFGPSRRKCLANFVVVKWARQFRQYLENYSFAIGAFYGALYET